MERKVLAVDEYAGHDPRQRHRHRYMLDVAHMMECYIHRRRTTRETKYKYADVAGDLALNLDAVREIGLRNGGDNEGITV